MNEKRIARLTATVLLSIAGFSAYGFSDGAAARPAIDPYTYVLQGIRPFTQATAVATVTRLTADRFSVSLAAEHLPAPTIVHAKFARHAYVAWLVNGGVMHGPLRMAAVGLTATGGGGHYAGWGVVRISGITSVIISAEPTAQAYMPILPILTVLASPSHQM